MGSEGGPRGVGVSYLNSIVSFCVVKTPPIKNDPSI